MATSTPATIIDIHCHIASEEFFPRSFLDGIVDNMAAILESKGVVPKKRIIAAAYGTKWHDAQCDQLIEEMDIAGISQSVLLLPDFTYALRDCTLTIAEMVDRHKMVLNRHAGRLLAFAGVDPRWGADGLSLMEKAIRDYHFHGMKLYPPCGYSPADKMLYPFYELCAAYAVPVLLHTGPTSPALSFSEACPINIDKPARDFPSVDFILAHGSVHYADECAMLCSHRPNVFLDVSGFEATALTNIRAMFERGINHKVLFGTDWPIFRVQGKQKDFVDRLTTSHGAFPESMSDDDKSLFFYKNAMRILAKRKGAIPDRASAINENSV